MPGNPLTDPNWPTELADQVERMVGTVREKTTVPVIHLARAVVYGLLAGILGLFALVLFLVAAVRVIQVLLDLVVTWEQAVYLSYLILGGILCVLGAFFLAKRHLPDA
jgi:hypothetical protein